VVCGGGGAGLPAGWGECADVYEHVGVGLGGEQYGACAVFSGGKDWACSTNPAELECEVAGADGVVPLAATDGDFGAEDEFAVPRPADGERA